jgi:hypothetical protein
MPPRHRYSGHEVSVLMVFFVDEPSTGDLATYRSPTRRNLFATTADFDTRPSSVDDSDSDLFGVKERSRIDSLPS